jgi:ankyrin repeat protein
MDTERAAFESTLYDLIGTVNGQDHSMILQVAATFGYDNIIQLLLEKGTDINALWKTISTALIAASYSGRDETVKLLLEKGADIHAHSQRHSTALHAASACGHDQIIKQLIEKGADVNAEGKLNSPGWEVWTSARYS